MLQQWYDKIGCRLVECAGYLTDNDCLMCDEEGALSMRAGMTGFRFLVTPIMGNALVVGVDEDGETIATKMNAAEIANKITFFKIG